MTNTFETDFLFKPSESIYTPDCSVFKKCLEHTSSFIDSQFDVCFITVTKIKMASLNINYRNKTGPTNVLSFPESPSMDKICGTIYFSPEIIHEENAGSERYWCLLIVHSLLHLSGYTHENDSDAEFMEAAEDKILNEITKR
jgi:probable rRNA maturation factor